MSEAPGSEKILLKPAEAAEALGISPRHLVTLMQRGEIPVVRVGRLLRFRPEDLAAWAARQAATPYQKRPANNRRDTEGSTDG